MSFFSEILLNLFAIEIPNVGYFKYESRLNIEIIKYLHGLFLFHYGVTKNNPSLEYQLRASLAAIKVGKCEVV